MPSAMPSIAPMIGANSGTSTTAAARPTRLELTASPPIAMRQRQPGRHHRPEHDQQDHRGREQPEHLGSGLVASASWTARPPSAIVSPSRSAASAAASSRSVSSTGMSLGLVTSR